MNQTVCNGFWCGRSNGNGCGCGCVCGCGEQTTYPANNGCSCNSACRACSCCSRRINAPIAFYDDDDDNCCSCHHHCCE